MWLALLATAGAASATQAAAPGDAVRPLHGTVAVTLDRVVNRFAPDEALGAGVDGQAAQDLAQIYTSDNVRGMRSAGLGPLTYRLRTELGGEAWHWNPRGRWSDARRRQGYWTSSSRAGPRFNVAYGYRLPRRGETFDQANDDGYSRLDDGDPTTFWKSNPYLDARLGGRRMTGGPQWAMLDLGRPRPIDALRIDWGEPYARRFVAQYWSGVDAFTAAIKGTWRAFPRGGVRGHGGTQTVRLAPAPMSVRFVRVLLTHSSHSAPPGSRDPRDRLGYALRELHVGRLERSRLRDLVRHAPSHGQTAAYVSSTDPWHRATDLDPSVAQPSFDRVFRSGLTNRQPVMLPVPLLYGTPADAAAELRFLRARRYRVGRVELGEEPDGQFVAPEDDAALWLRFARALRRVDPHVVLGGPSFATSIPEWEYWPDARGNTSWISRFLASLRAGGRAGEFRFFSFEWYPFDNVCANPARQLVQAPNLLAQQLRGLEREGLPARLPIVLSEYGYSAFAARAEVDLAGALLDADVIGEFLALGGRAAYLYGYEPSGLIRETTACEGWGNLTLLLSDRGHRILYRTAAFSAMRLVTGQWAGGGHRIRRVFPAASDVRDPAGLALVTAYAVGRPDGRLAVLLINKDPRRAVRVRVTVRSARTQTLLAGPLDAYTLSSRQYRWHARGPAGYPAPDLPAAHAVVRERRADVVRLPPFSLTVIRTRRPLADQLVRCRAIVASRSSRCSPASA